MMASMEDFDIESICATEIDGALLMEFLEDSCEEYLAEDSDRLWYVMRSLEAEIGDASTATLICDDESTTGGCGPFDDDGGGLLEELLSDLDADDSSRSTSTCAFEEPYDWVEMDVAAPSPSSAAAGHDDGGWYMDEDEMVDFGEGKVYAAIYHGQSMIDQVYSPLWQ